MNKFKNILVYFICFSFIGWIYEVSLFLIEDHIFVNRGVLYGPWLPVYGFGGMLIYFLFNKLKDKKVYISKINIRPILVFIYITLTSMTVELITTYISELFKTDWKTLWYYGDEFLNFEGRIALFPGLKFGLIGLLGIYIIVPLIDKFNKINKKPIVIITNIILVLFIIDAIIHLFIGSTYNGPV